MRFIFTLASILALPGVVAAQSSSLFPSSGSTGGGTTGRSTGVTGGGGGGTAASSLQQSLGGGGGGSLSGGSGATFGSGELQGPQFTQFGQAGQAALNTEFVGVGQSGQFVGVGQTTGTTTQQGFGSQQGFAGFGNRGQTQGQSQTRSTTSGRSRIERLQPVARIAFDFEPNTSVVVQSRLESHVSEYGFGVQDLDVALDSDGVLTLSGVAQSEDDRRLAEAFMRLEPGVRQVVNQIVVAP